jgi:hypothetical protein
MAVSFRQDFVYICRLLMCFSCDVSLIFRDLITLIKRRDARKLRHATLWHLL